MSRKEIIPFSNCLSCKNENVCCGAEARPIILTLSEAKKLPHSRLPNGQFQLPAGWILYLL
jgi:hypothetical protein